MNTMNRALTVPQLSARWSMSYQYATGGYPMRLSLHSDQTGAQLGYSIIVTSLSDLQLRQADIRRLSEDYAQQGYAIYGTEGRPLVAKQ